MYNLRARARTTIAGPVRPQLGVRVCDSPAKTSQATPSQTMVMLEDVEIVPETEVSGVSTDANLANDAMTFDEATQPPTNIAHSAIATAAEQTLDFTLEM